MNKKWHKFNKDDESTWPVIEYVPAHFWLWTPTLAALCHVAKGFKPDDWLWSNASHWMKIQMPEDPQ